MVVVTPSEVDPMKPWVTGDAAVGQGGSEAFFQSRVRDVELRRGAGEIVIGPHHRADVYPDAFHPVGP